MRPECSTKHGTGNPLTVIWKESFSLHSSKPMFLPSVVNRVGCPNGMANVMFTMSYDHNNLLIDNAKNITKLAILFSYTTNPAVMDSTYIAPLLSDHPTTETIVALLCTYDSFKVLKL